MSSFFICDASVPAARLGKRLKRLTFEEVASRALTNRSLRHQQGEADEEVHSSHPEAQSSAPLPPAPEARAPDAVEALLAPTAGELVEPETKRQRVLKMMKSERPNAVRGARGHSACGPD